MEQTAYIMEVQKRLKASDLYKGEVDGISGPQTEAPIDKAIEMGYDLNIAPTRPSKNNSSASSKPKKPGFWEQTWNIYKDEQQTKKRAERTAENGSDVMRQILPNVG